MDILISFCNPIIKPGYLSLGLLNAETMDLSILELPAEVPQTSTFGLAVSPNYVFVGFQYYFGGHLSDSKPPSLLIFDRKNFKLLNHYKFQLVRDVHSFSFSSSSNILYVVSTGTDEVIELELNGASIISEKVFWRPEPNGERADNYHINAIYEFEGDLFVSGFGKKQEAGKWVSEANWNSARNGFIYNIQKRQQIIAGLEHPHSIVAVKNKLAFCESRKKRLRFVGDERTLELPGYTRGLCIADGKLFIGTSVTRKKSKSTGKLINHENFENSECAISCVSLENLEIENTVLLSYYANEIYDLLPVEGTSGWLTCPISKINSRSKEIWDKQVKTSLQEIQKIIPSGETLILVDDNKWENGEKILPNHTRLYFIERDGIYWGPPESDELAILELNRMQQEKGVRFIAFGSPSFWWFDHYAAFNAYLRERYNCVLENVGVVIFDIQDPLTPG